MRTHLSNLSLAAVGVAVAAVVAAGCGSSGSSGSSGSAGSGSSGASSSATVSTKSVSGLGTVLVDRNGRALYSPDQERGGRIMCTGACTSVWKPLTVAGVPTGASGVGHLGVVQRSGGVRQVTMNGRPLYTFVQDSGGQVTGQGAKDAFGGRHFTWHVLSASGAAATGSTASSGGNGGGGYGKGGGGYGY